jgi:hypothetical protein
MSKKPQTPMLCHAIMIHRVFVQIHCRGNGHFLPRPRHLWMSINQSRLQLLRVPGLQWHAAYPSAPPIQPPPLVSQGPSPKHCDTHEPRFAVLRQPSMAPLLPHNESDKPSVSSRRTSWSEHANDLGQGGRQDGRLVLAGGDCCSDAFD